ncbi:MAG: DNA replication/repair protein RecF [Candidatus Nanosyncoccaceae bacterium]|jgi:DNA replication and repair protein RecF
MIISELKVGNFRCHKDFKINFSPQKTLIYGLNGSGKTSLIEAVYLLLRGKSFRGYDNDILKSKCDWFKVELQIKDTFSNQVESREIRFRNKPTKTKQFRINQKNYQRIPKNKKIPVVLFQPDDLNLINGSPSRRRQFFDELISQLKPEQNSYLSRYERALRQRNNLIKNNLNITLEDLFSWNIILSNYGAKIIQNRLEIINLIQQEINQIYQKITNVKDEITIKYSQRYSNLDQIQPILFEALNKKENLLFGTLVGPHRDDFIIKFNQNKANQHTSRGENRSIILSLKIIEANLIKERYNYSPIILLDDVLSELDQKRRDCLLSFMSKNQIIITSTEKVNIKQVKVVKI